jgi:DHA2 family methylenomycin A resistance protein-like MFS transporter
MAILYKRFAETGDLAKMLGIWTTIISVATGTGSFIGGALIQSFGWRSVFLINIPIGLITITYIAMNVSKDQVPRNNQIDVLGNSLLILVISSLVIFLVVGNQFGYANWKMMAFLLAAILFSIAFGFRAIHSPAPIIPRTLLMKPEFTAANLVGFLTNVSLYGIVLVLGLYYQMALHFSSLIAGLLILPGMTVLIIGNIFYTHQAKLIGPKKLALGSTGLTLIGAIAMLVIASTIRPIPVWAIILNFAIMSIGIGVVVPASTTLLMQAAGGQYSSIAGATLNANKQIGGLFGTAIMGIIIANLGTNWAMIIQLTFVVNIGLYGLAMLLLKRFVVRSTH